MNLPRRLSFAIPALLLVVAMLVAGGYRIGQDMAHRDNVRAGVRA